jgi:radical SAM superfamily enzyme YgiQ (UPF0313 family)
MHQFLLFSSFNDIIKVRKIKSIEKIIKRNREELKAKGRKIKCTINTVRLESSMINRRKQGRMVTIFPILRTGSRREDPLCLKNKSTANAGNTR